MVALAEREEPSISRDALACEIVDAYAADSVENKTLSVTRIDGFGLITDGIERLAQTLLDAGGLSGNPVLRRVYEEALRFKDQMDLGDFAARLAEALPFGPVSDAARALIETLDDHSYAKTGDPASRYGAARGLSIDAPVGSRARAVGMSDLPRWKMLAHTYFSPDVPRTLSTDVGARPRVEGTDSVGRTPRERSHAMSTQPRSSRPTRSRSSAVVLASTAPSAGDWRTRLAPECHVHREPTGGLVLALRGEVSDHPWRVFKTIAVDESSHVVDVRLDTYREARSQVHDESAFIDVDIPLPNLGEGSWTVRVSEKTWP